MFFKQFLLISIIINISLCERLSNEYLEGWGEKVINEDTQDYSKLSIVNMLDLLIFSIFNLQELVKIIELI